MTIDEVTEETVSGEFEFTAQDEEGNTTEVTDGEFSTELVFVPTEVD